MQVRESTDDDLGAMERHLPTGAARVHAAHRARAATGELTHLVALDDDGTPVGTGAVLWRGPRGGNAVGDVVEYTYVAPDGSEHEMREQCLLLLRRLDATGA